jgi:hypothetical protein
MSVKKPKIANSFQNFLKERKIIEANNGGVRVVARNNNISEESAPEEDFEDSDRKVDENNDSEEEFNLRIDSTQTLNPGMVATTQEMISSPMLQYDQNALQLIS